MAGYDPALVGMPDIEVLNILRMICDVIGSPSETRKFYLQTIKASNDPSCKVNKASQINTDKVGANDTNANMPDYFRPSINREADKEQVIFKNTIHNEFSYFFRNRLLLEHI